MRFINLPLVIFPFVIFPLFTAAPAFAQPVVSNVRIDDLGHSSVRVTWDATAFPILGGQRIQYGPTAAYGNIQNAYKVSTSATNETMILTGQTAGSTIHLCPQTSDGTWSSCANLDQIVTFAPLPSPHPSPATLPATFSHVPPAPGNCTALTANSFATLQNQINTAAAGQSGGCYIITVPAGTVITGQILVPPPVDVDFIASTDAGGNTVTKATSVNTYSNGERVRIEADDYAGNSGTPAGLSQGIDYCVANLSGNTFQLQLWPACNSVVNLVSNGFGPWTITPYPPPTSNWIQVTTSGVTQPFGVRSDPSWAANFFTWNPPAIGLSTANNTIRLRGGAHHYYFGPGIYFNAPSSGQTDTTDPAPYNGWVFMNPNNSFIAVKGDVLDGGGFPERIKNVFQLADGGYLDVSDNYFKDISYWRPNKVNLVPAVTNSTTVTVSSGSYFTNLGNCPAVASFTATNPTGSGTAFFTLNPVTCAPLATIPGGTAVTIPAGSTATGTDWPRASAGGYSQALLGTCNFSGGTWGGCANADDSSNYFFSALATEGPQIITACGPGPLNVRNNYFESHSIIWHLDDSCSANPTLFVGDVLFRRNTFATPDRFRAGAPGNNGAAYSNRNQWESKRGQRIWLDGNVFFGNFTNVNMGPTIVINHNGAECGTLCAPTDLQQDFTATNNTIHDASGGFQLGGGPPDGNRVPTLGRRFTVKNNLIYNIDPWIYREGRAGAAGYCFELSFGGEDEIIDHNTCHSIAGQQAVWLLGVNNFIEGASITNNVFYFHQDAGLNGTGLDWSAGSTPTVSGTGKTMLDGFFTPSYTWSKNLLIPGYGNSQTMTGDSDATAVINAYNGLSNTFIRSEATVAARVTAAGWNNIAANNFRFSAQSPYISGGGSHATDGTDIGANIDQLEDAQGLIKNVRALSVGPTTASIAFHAPDPGAACYVGYGSGAVTTWTRSNADTSASQERTITLTGLAGKTAYNYQVWCSGAAATSTRNLRTL